MQKSRDWKKRFAVFAEGILAAVLRRLPENLCGNPKILENMYGKRYWRKDTARLVAETRQKTALGYLLVLLLVLFITGSLLWNVAAPANRLLTLERPVPGEPAQTTRLTAELRYGKEQIKESVAVRISARIPTEKEVREGLAALASRLPEMILGENPDLAHVTTSLQLLTEDPESGILIEWRSDMPTLIGNDGRLDSIAAEAGGKAGQPVTLTAILESYGFTEKVTLAVRIRPPAEENHKDALKARLAQTIEALEKGNNTSGEKVPNTAEQALTQTLPDGTAIIWTRTEKNHAAESFLLCACLFGGVFFSRYRKAKRETRKDSEAILRDLPEFMNRFVLLLSAGLVTETAVRKIAADYRRHERKERKPLYEGFCEVERRTRETNASFLAELHQFAQKSGVRELVRLSALLEETIHTGTALNEKLETEAALLWFYRKKNAEEKGRIAETKLTFPLVIQLLVLLLITLAPVFLKLK